MNLIDITDQYATNLRKTYDELKLLENKIKTLNPSNVRKNYDKYWDIVNQKEIETNEEKEELEESINNLEDGKELLEKISLTIQNVKNVINSFRVGTLQGQSRQSLQNMDNSTNSNDEIGQNVINQPYNELEDINNKNNLIGGKRSNKSRKYKYKYKKTKRSIKRSYKKKI
jgi:hypothetical protein